MPSLFLYAVMFLGLLTVVGFAACLREGAEPKGEAARPDGAGDRPLPPPGREGSPARRSAAIPRRQPDAGRIDEAAARLAQAASPELRTTFGSGAAPAAGIAQAAPDPGRSAGTEAPGTRPPGMFEAARPGADSLAHQVADLARQVAELKAERQGFEKEIRRLHRAVGEAAAAIDDLGAGRSAMAARGPSPNARHISIHDLRVRRVS